MSNRFDTLTKAGKALAGAFGHCGLFADRDTVQEALNYAYKVGEACGDAKPHVTTAVHVVMNSIACHVAELIEKLGHAAGLDNLGEIPSTDILDAIFNRVNELAGHTTPEISIDHGGWWGSHPNYPLEDWQSEVANNDTRLSYWEWVTGKVSEDEQG
jgi:hypothetical protein